MTRYYELLFKDRVPRRSDDIKRINGLQICSKARIGTTIKLLLKYVAKMTLS